MRIRLTAVCVVVTFSSAFAQQQGDPALPLPTPTPDETIPAPASTNRYDLQREDYKQDWRQAGENGLGDRLRSHIVRLNDDNALTGRLNLIEVASGFSSPVSDVKIRFVRKGDVKAEVTPEADGTFSVEDLEAGVYSMIAAPSGTGANEGFIAWSVNVQEKLDDLAKIPPTVRFAMMSSGALKWPQEVRKELDVRAAAVPPSNFTALKKLLTQYLPSEDSTLYVDGADIPDDMEDEPRDAEPGTQLSQHQIMLTEDGRLLGRIRRLQPDSGRDLRIRQLNVFMIRQDDIQAQEPVAPNGTFAFEDVKPGVYSLVAAGRDGFLAFSIEVLGRAKPDEPALEEDTDVASDSERRSPVRRVGFKLTKKAQAELQIDVALCSPEDFNQQNLAALTNNFTTTENTLADAGAPAGTPVGPGGFGAPPAGGAAPPAGGGGGFGGGGGGAGGGFGGGLGGILLGAGLGAGIGAVVDDDDESRPQASPSSPGVSTGGQ